MYETETMCTERGSGSAAGRQWCSSIATTHSAADTAMSHRKGGRKSSGSSSPAVRIVCVWSPKAVVSTAPSATTAHATQLIHESTSLRNMSGPISCDTSTSHAAPNGDVSEMGAMASATPLSGTGQATMKKKPSHHLPLPSGMPKQRRSSLPLPT